MMIPPTEEDGVERVYFDTSAFNYMKQELSWEGFLSTRELQRSVGRELLLSTVTLWELMLASRETPDFLLYAAQNFFSDRLLASPSEIVVRYLESAYPENVINYSAFADGELADIWQRMTTDNSVTLIYDQDDLAKRTKLLRQVSRNLPSLVRYPKFAIHDEWLRDLAHVVDVYYSCLQNDGFLPQTPQSPAERQCLFKSVILVVMALFLFRFDLYPSHIHKFWSKTGVDVNNPTAALQYFFERYPETLRRGPILEIASMIAHQVQQPGGTNRGVLLDSFHAVYTPYVHTVMTADDGFFALAGRGRHFAAKFQHVRAINLRERLFISSMATKTRERG